MNSRMNGSKKYADFIRTSMNSLFWILYGDMDGNVVSGQREGISLQVIRIVIVFEQRMICHRVQILRNLWACSASFLGVICLAGLETVLFQGILSRLTPTV